MNFFVDSQKITNGYLRHVFEGVQKKIIRLCNQVLICIGNQG